MSTPFSCFDYKQWRSFIEDTQTELSDKKYYLQYLELCESKQIPYILSFKQLPYIFSIDIIVLSTMITFPNKYYRTFTIPKRNGSQRTISTPYITLSNIQKWILDSILNKVSINENAKGFCKNKSILNHAEAHKANHSLLKLDISNFFPSISIRRVVAAFKYIGYPKRISASLARFCCLDGALPQGACTSPMLSNIICNKLDIRLALVSEKFSLEYTRYADDLAFSGKYIPHSFIPVVEKILKDEGFQINNNKTVLINGLGKKVLTGISINNGKLSIPREKKRLLRSESHNALKIDPYELIISKGDPIYYERLLGKFMFWKQVEPESKYVNSMIEKLKMKQKEIRT